MKYLITERQYGVLLEQQSSTSIANISPVLNNIVLFNKKYLGLPANTQITPEYTKKMSDELTKKNISPQQRTLLGSVEGFIPIWGDVLDVTSFLDGLNTGDIAKMNGGAIGLMSPHFSYKMITSFVDYLAEKLVGKENADYMEKKRNEIVNMGDHDRQELFKRYGMGGYDKWVKAGRPPLH
jgi:hypothetical protein